MTSEEIIYQLSEEWKEKRLGKVTASRVKDILPLKSGKYSTKRDEYIAELIMGRFGIMKDVFVNDAMRHGTEIEPFARFNYEAKNDCKVEQLDFIDHPTIPFFGASPDGRIIGTKGLLEIKGPTSATHFDYIIEGVVPDEYKPQMAVQMACTKTEWCDFLSFDNRCPEGLQYFQIRYERDDAFIKLIESEVIKINAEVEAKYQILSKKLFEGK